MRSLFQKAVLAGLSLIGAAAVLAQTPVPVATPHAPPAKPPAAKSAPQAAGPKKILFWKAVSGSNVEYFLGSIHIGTPDMYPLPKVIDDGFHRSKVLVEELDLGDVNQGDVAKYVQANGMYVDGDNLWNHLDKPTADKAKKYFAKYGMPDQVVGMFKPWLASMMASVAPMLNGAMKPDLGIDMHFYNLAKTDKKTIVGAESMDFQLQMLSSMPQDQALAYLTYEIGQSAKSDEESANIEKLWKAGDADDLDRAINSVPAELEPMMKKILYDRNPHMADVAEKYLNAGGGGPCFFVVGAGHLVGDRGVISILKQRGYNVFQLSPN